MWQRLLSSHQFNHESSGAMIKEQLSNFVRHFLPQRWKTPDLSWRLAPHEGGGLRPGGIPLGVIGKFLPSAPVIVEAGAHIGADTVRFRRHWRRATIHCFEPIPRMYEQLCQNTERWPNVHRYPMALSERAGTATIFVSGGASDGSSSLMRPKDHLVDNPTVSFETQLDVQTTTLDLWAEQCGVARVDFLWLDMQGHEFAALNAAPKVLSQVRAIFTEVNHTEVFEGVVLYPAYRRWLESKGFKLFAEELYKGSIMNALFVR